MLKTIIKINEVNFLAFNFPTNLLEKWINPLVFLPEILISFLIVAILAAKALKSDNYKNFIKFFLLANLASFTVLISYLNIKTNIFLFFNYTYCSNIFSISFKAIILLLVSIILIFTLIREKFENKIKKTIISKNSEYILLILFGTLFFLVIVSSHDLFLTYLVLEGLSLLLAILIIGYGPIFKSTEAAIKYFSISAFTSGFVLYGISIVYKKLQTTNYTEIHKFIQQCHENESYVDYSWLIIAMVFILVGFFFKLTVAPFHLWAVEVYGNVPMTTAAFIFLPYKFSLLAAFFKIVTYVFQDLRCVWGVILSILALTCIFWGSVGAIYEDKIKKFLVFASINQTGFILLGLGTSSFYGISSSLMHLIFYFISNIALFMFLIVIKTHNIEKELMFIHQLQHAYIPKVYAFFLIPIIFSMAGFPPLMGFFTKYFLLLEVFSEFGPLYVLIILFLNIISTFYYFRIIKNIFFFDSGRLKIETRSILPTNFWNIVTAVFLICSGVLAGSWIFLPEIINIFNVLTENILYPFFSQHTRSL